MSLFGKIEERTGLRQVKRVNDISAPHKYASKFTINKDCISCTDNMSTHMNLFKIACINYLPNLVSYQGKAIPRKELISL